jgi:hypothetical protein
MAESPIPAIVDWKANRRSCHLQDPQERAILPEEAFYLFPGRASHHATEAIEHGRVPGAGGRTAEPARSAEVRDLPDI